MKHRLIKLSTITVIVISAIILSSGITSSTGGGYNDLVEELYKQEVNKNPSLEKLESSIKNYYIKRQDAIETYNKFNDYNRRYYSDAKNKLNTITDVALKEKASKAIAQSEKNYNTKMSEWNKQIIDMSEAETTLKNYHATLKIIITTPVIEDYQNKALPSTNSIQESNTELKKIIESIKSITDK